MGLEDLMAMPTITASISYGRVALGNTQFVHSELISEIPGARFHGKGEDYWTVPLSWVSLVCLVNTFAEKLELSEELTAWATYEWESKIGPCTELRTGEGESFVTDELLEQIAELVPESRSPIKPVNRRYQVAGALLLATAKRYLLLDEQGTGKMTETAMALSLYPDTLPALIVAPSSTLYTWRRELGVFGIDSVILDGSAVQRRKMVEQFRDDETGPRVMICSYAIVAKHSRVAPYGNIKLSDDHRTPKDLNEIAWATVVADEVHRAKSPKAVQTRALWAVSDHAEYRWGLSGTPIEGSPLDFWALLHFIDPVSWPSSVKYRDRWVEHFINFFGGIEVQGIRADRAEEWRRTTEWQWRRKMLEGLPPRTNEFRFCELKGKALKTYKDMEKQLMAETGDDDVVLFAQNHMVKAGRLLQMANSAIQVETSYDDDGEEVIEVTPIEPSPKLDLMMDTLEDFEGVPLILWFDKVKFMRLAQDRLNAKGIKYVLIDGSMQPKARDASVAAFQNGDVDLILLSVAAAAEGITLTRAPVSINVQRNWSLILNDQKGSRNLRIGSEIHDEILEIDLITQGTIEWDQYMDLEEKRKIRDQVISPLSVS